MHVLPYAGAVCPVCGTSNIQLRNESHQLPCGSVLAERFLVGYALGEGGFGITYVGWDLERNRKIAIKEYYPDGIVARDARNHLTIVPLRGKSQSDFVAWRNRFAREAQTMASLAGIPNIVTVREYFAENNTAYIVMDFVEGQTLRQLAESNGGRLSAGEVLRMMTPVMSALAQVHEQGLLHRDISPDNIIRQPDGTIVIIDFGSAREISEDGEKSSTVNVKHGYAPEEQYRRHGKQGPWTDVYAICATIYKLTTGKTPPQALDRLTGDDPLIPPNRLGADFTRSQQDAILKGLSVHAEDRQQDMQELRLSLKRSAPSGTPARLSYGGSQKTTWKVKTDSGLLASLRRIRERFIYWSQKRRSHHRRRSVLRPRFFIILLLFAAALALFFVLRNTGSAGSPESNPTPSASDGQPSQDPSVITDLVLTPTPTPDLSPVRAYISSQKLNLRQTPSLSGHVLTVLTQYTPITVYRAEGEFYYVTVDGTDSSGYVFATYVRLLGPNEEIPSAETPVPEIQETRAGFSYGYISKNNVNLRTYPSTSSEIIGVLPYMTTLDVFAKAGSFYRVRIRSTEQEGYVYADYVSRFVEETDSPDSDADEEDKKSSSSSKNAPALKLSEGHMVGNNGNITYTVANTGSVTVSSFTVSFVGYNAEGGQIETRSEVVEHELAPGSQYVKSVYSGFSGMDVSEIAVSITKAEAGGQSFSKKFSSIRILSD